MTPEFEKRRDEILEEALSMPSEDCSQFLERECAGDIVLRREVERLLEVNQQMGASFLANAAVNWLTPDFAAGQKIGRYIIEELIGKGGMSRVYRARDPDIGRCVALKVLLPAGAEGNQRFIAELRILGRIRHETVVRVYDCGEFGGLPYLVMEHLDGEDLAYAIQEGRCGGFAKKLDIALQLAMALSHVHTAGIIHRDVKPANIFLEPSGQIRLMDFGIARYGESALTLPSVLIGTPEYMSPEQVKGQPATHLSDIYSYGVVLYELFTGTKAVSGSIVEAFYKVAHEQLPLELLREAELPAELIQLIDRATAKDPCRRPQSFTGILEQLENPSLLVHDKSAGLRNVLDVHRPPPLPLEQVPAPSSAQQLEHRDHSGDLEMMACVDVPGPRLLVGAVSTVFGIMVGLALLVEVAYEWPTYATWVVPTSGVAAIASAVVALAIFTHLCRRALSGQPTSLGRAVVVLFGWSILVAFAIAPALPSHPIVVARFQTMAAQVGWIKSVGEALFLPMLALVPLHTVFALEYEVRHRPTAPLKHLLLEHPNGVAPAGMFYVPPRVAWTIFLVVGGAWLVANGRLFESLEQTHYFGLFLTLDFARVSLGLLTLLWVLLWYIVALTHLKRKLLETPAD